MIVRPATHIVADLPGRTVEELPVWAPWRIIVCSALHANFRERPCFYALTAVCSEGDLHSIYVVRANITANHNTGISTDE